MTGQHAADALFGYDIEKRVAWVGRGIDGRFARLSGTPGERRVALGLPRPAHAGKPQTVMGIPADRLAHLVPYAANGLKAAAELTLAMDRVQAMFDRTRTVAIVTAAEALSKGTPLSLAEAIHQVADREARAEALSKAAQRGTPRVSANPHADGGLLPWQRDRLGHVYAPCTLEPWVEAGGGCTCLVNPRPFTHYGAVEPGDALEYDPDCPRHGATIDSPTTDDKEDDDA